MKFNSKRILSAVLALAMTVTTMVFAPITTQAAAGDLIDVWDFGGVAEEDTSIYRNNIDVAYLDAFDAVGDEASGNLGKFLAAGTFEFPGGLTNMSNANDRLYYQGSAGLRSYGDNSKAIYAYDDGYTANGMWYANGPGGNNRRLFKLSLSKGDAVSIYAGASNTAEIIAHFTSEAGDDVTKNVGKGVNGRLDFIAGSTDTYTIWFDVTGGGKPIVNRIVKYPSVSVSGNIVLNGLNPENYIVLFKNEATGEFTEAVLNGDGTYAAELSAGYSYTAIMKGAVGFGFTAESKIIAPTAADIMPGMTHDLSVETKEVYNVTGAVTGFAEGYSTENLSIDLVPDADSMADTVTAELDKAALTYKATLEPDVNYTVVLNGVNDYQVAEGGVINNSQGDITNEIKVELKPMYTVSGSIEGLNGAAVSSITFTNMEDGYTYNAEAFSSSDYSVSLRNGNYAVSAVSDTYKTSTHVVVKGKAAVKNILFVEINPTAPTVDTSVRDIYVGCEGKVNNFATMKEAMAAAKVMNPQSEAERITVHIAPGVYREQIAVETPYVTFVKEGAGEVKLTWYYGIGYEYYSADATGYYNEESKFDKFEKNAVSKWGTAVWIKEAAANFKAEGITFENSFNKYITDEEIADGVTETGALPARTYNTDVKSKAATERGTAISIESDNTEFKDCVFLGSQDTLYIGGKFTNHVYFKNCEIEGNTDYIFGSGNAVFDGCELRFAGYSDSAVGGYITAGRSYNYDGYKGYLFRSCAITKADGMLAAEGYFGRPWDVNADITFLNCTLPDAGTIAAEGWTSMNSVLPENANFKEYGTVLTDGTAVDTSARVSGTVLADASAVDPIAYFNDWMPTYYTEDTLPVEFSVDPYFSTDGDVLLPATGNTFTVKYSLGANDANDASAITYSLVAEDGSETIIKTVSAPGNKGVVLTKDMIGSKIKATVAPKTIYGNTAEAKSTITEKAITLGSGSIDTPRPSGKAVIFLAGDSTVKDYSAGAINNSGANRPEGAWGEFFGKFFDSNYEVMDYAEGGRSSRTFIDGTKSDGSDKYFDKIKAQMVSGDYLFVQFGHNDSSANYADRYVPTGDPDAAGVYPAIAPTAEGAGDGTFKWYLQQYVDAAKAVGATPVMVTPVSRRYYNADGTIKSHHGDNDEYVTITKQVAEENGIDCIDLYAYSKDLYESLYKIDGADGESALATRMFAVGEKTHHSKLGGFILAEFMAKTLKDNPSIGLSEHIIAPVSTYAADDENYTEFIVNSKGEFTGYGINDEGKYDTNIVVAKLTELAQETLDYLASKTADEPEKVYGNVNGDGEVTAEDAADLLQQVLTGTAEYNELADTVADGVIDSADVAAIIQHILDSSFTLPRM